MFGQSAVMAWFGYSAAEQVAKALGASDDTATGVAVVVGDTACIATGVATVDPVGTVAGIGIVAARASGALGDKESAIGSVMTVVNAGLRIFGGGSDAW
jgi:hypothetical protein